MTWIKCSEQMPEPYTEVLVSRGVHVTAKRLVKGWGKNENKTYWDGCSMAGLDYFDHWMPLPEPPKDNP